MQLFLDQIGEQFAAAMEACSDRVDGLQQVEENAESLLQGDLLGALSLVIWTLTSIVSIKNVSIMLRAEKNVKEGLLLSTFLYEY